MAEHAAANFSEWALSNRIAFATWVTGHGTPERRDECLEATRRNLLLHNDAARENYIEGDDIDAIMLSAFCGGYDYVLIQAAGHLLRDKSGIKEALTRLIEPNFFCAGHVLDKSEAYYSLHHQCIFVSVSVWDQIGRPKFGNAGHVTRRLHTPSRSESNFHDAHTPLWIKSSGVHTEYASQEGGWNFISSGLDAGKGILPFPVEVRHRKTYLYPEHDVNYGFQLGSFRRRALRWGEAAWVVNTEELRLGSVDASQAIGDAIGVASGLKLYLLLDKMGHGDNTGVHYVDASEATLDFKRWLVDNWDGGDYAAAVYTWSNEVAPHRRLPSGTSTRKIDAAAAELTFQFGGRDALREKWKRFRSLRHTYHCLDLLTTDVDKLLDIVAGSSSSCLIWLSNIFHSYYTHTLLRHDDVAGMFSGLILKLRKRNPDAILICKDPHHYPVAARVKDISIKTSSPYKTNMYAPQEIFNWMEAELEMMRDVNRERNDERDLKSVMGRSEA